MRFISVVSSLSAAYTVIQLKNIKSIHWISQSGRTGEMNKHIHNNKSLFNIRLSLYGNRDRHSRPLRGFPAIPSVPIDEWKPVLLKLNGRFCRCTVPKSTSHLQRIEEKGQTRCKLHELAFNYNLPSRGWLSKGSFFITSIPSPPPVSFLDASATEYSWATWYCKEIIQYSCKFYWCIQPRVSF